MSKQNKRKHLARLITELVNRNTGEPQCLPQVFIEKYSIPRYRFGAYEVAWVAQAFRVAWDKSQNEAFAQNLEQVFADRFYEVFKEIDEQSELVKVDGFTYKRGTPPAELMKYTRPAFRVVPGKRGLVFSPRDLLDRMARELLRAFSSNRLRVCGRKGKDCPTPLFVAYHAKQKYCYRGCSEQALSEWKVDSWEKRRKKKSSIQREK
jgi:hypothetical protein